MKRDHTWSHAKSPVKVVVNRTRGKGITVIGTIGSVMSKPVLMQAAATNEGELLKFLPRIRAACPTVVGALHLVLDNHSSHHSRNVAQICRLHNLVLHFMPSYSPEFNSIESLWATMKGRLRKALNAERDVNMTQPRFTELLQDCIETVTPEESIATARGGNREYLHRLLDEMHQDRLRDADVDEMVGASSDSNEASGERLAGND
jgi:hypothetical protein